MKRSWIARLVTAASVLAFFAIAPSASALVVQEPGGRLLGITPRHGVRPAAIPGSFAVRNGVTPHDASGRVDYNGGPVVHSSSAYVIFWTPSGFSVPGNAESLMTRYFANAAADSGKATNVFSVLRQYTDGSGFADYRQSFSSSQVIVDTDPYPSQDLVNCPTIDTDPTFYPTCVTDQQLQSEIANVVGAHGLPTGVGTNAPIYYVVTPPDVNVCMDAAHCSSNFFCAYHGEFNEGSTDILYAAIPFFLRVASGDPNQDPKTCQADGDNAIQEPNGDLADVAISYMSHETSETLTDPLLSGWFDDASPQNEVGDNCAATGSFDPQDGTNPNAFLPTLGGSPGGSSETPPGTLFDQQIAGNPYYTQSEWSNGDTNCEMRPTAGTLTPAFAVPSPGTEPAGAPGAFNPAPTTSSFPLSSATWSFDDGARIFNAGGTASQPVSHTFAKAGRHTVTLTVVDDRGNLVSTSRLVVVGSRPRAAFKHLPRTPHKGTTVKFKVTRSSDPDPGVKIVSYSWSFGDGKHASGRRVRHRYKKRRTYTVRLTVTNSLGVVSVISHKIRIK